MLLACKAVLFDCDGVLVDSDASVARAWSRWAREFGLDPGSVVASVHGRRAADTIAELLPPGARAAATVRIDELELGDAPSVRACPGAVDLLSSMPRFRHAVVTSATRALATARLRAAGLAPPPVLITADDLSVGKPAPDGYLAAARALAVDPADVAVLEDSPAGVEAARRAGVGVIVGIGARPLGSAATVVVPNCASLSWCERGLLVRDHGR